MAKILKKILFLIPFLIICLSIKNVYAEDLDIYRIKGYSNYRWVNPSTDETTDFTFKVYDNTFKVNYNINYNVNNVLYDKEHDFYFIIILQLYLPDDTYINCIDSYNYNGTCYYNNEWTSVYSKNYIATLSKKDEGKFWKSFFPRMPRIVDEKNGFYLTQIDASGSSKITSYISENPDNFDLIYSSIDKIYIGDKELTLKPEPEPEVPEEPDTPTPPIIEDLDLIYVPNYKEGNCVEIIDKDTIRLFENENTSDYIDYFINSHYISKQGQTDINYIKSCSNLKFTDKYYYRNDFPQILFIAICLCGGSSLFVYTLFKRFRKR